MSCIFEQLNRHENPDANITNIGQTTTKYKTRSILKVSANRNENSTWQFTHAGSLEIHVFLAIALSIESLPAIIEAMASVSKLRRVLITGTLSVAIASGALYGASLKMKQESKQEARKRQNLTPQEKIDALLVVREGLMRKKETLEEQIREIEERERRKDRAGAGGGESRGVEPTSDECTRELRGGDSGSNGDKRGKEDFTRLVNFDRSPAIPDNWKEINERLVRTRPSLSPSKFSDGEFRKFKRADTHASKEKPVTTTVIPIIEGDIGDPKCTGGGYVFGNLAPLTDGTLAQAKPDHFYGARPEQLDRQIRKELSDQIIPSIQNDLPMAPNFFLEAKGPDGSLAVATRQACYDGALGARGMHSLQSYRQDKSMNRPTTTMLTLLRQPITVKEMRDNFIAMANEHLSDAQFEHQTASIVAVVSQVSDASTVSNKTEYQDAQWSFTAPIEGREEEFQTPGRDPKKQKVSSIVSGDSVSNNPTGCPN
ncbi:uncharacterized protein CIMG_10065 [Coccidioides immitis RS]|uniref:Uncharacterized protein n=1 Tax=Coccidioides immitis (strain RS) TaxID=246410 RepID=J3K0R4_COCIM|nr:uncharacterized protein CIMG_10065 [Coccidioides immitis RS]EAS27460.3 hypothetical protein CIMG_10065 [Coccidioides immitis RS]